MPFFCRFEEFLNFSLTSLKNKIFIKKSDFDKFQNSILKFCLLPFKKIFHFDSKFILIKNFIQKKIKKINFDISKSNF